jgi:hypothetical protein
MGEAAKISLKAIGKQDTHLLSKDPEDSFFNDDGMRRHSNFRKYHRSRTVVNDSTLPNWPFGQSVKVQFNPQNMGDLLSNMWLSISMPGISETNTVTNSIKYKSSDFTDIVLSSSDQIILIPLNNIKWAFVKEQPNINIGYYGYRVKISGNGSRVIVGSPFNATIFIYKLQNSVWVLEDTITSNNDLLGSNITIDYLGETIVSGSIPKDDNGILSTNIYKRNGSSWSLIESVSYSRNTDEGPGIPYTFSLSDDGTKLSVGFAGVDRNNSFYPGVYIYTLNSNGNIVGSPVELDVSGYSPEYNKVALSGDGNTLIIGFHESSAATTYKFIGNSWVNSNFPSVNLTVLSLYGCSVSTNADGTKALVGDYGEGKVYLFEYNNLNWTLSSTFQSDVPTVNNNYGYDVSMNADGDYFIVGEPTFEIDSFNPPSTAYIYKYTDSTWSLINKLNTSDNTPYHGLSVDCNDSGTIYVTGEPIDDEGKIEITMINDFNVNYADQLGRHLLKSITMYVDEIEVEKIHDDWGIIYDELYLEISEKVANRYLINRNLGYDDATLNPDIANYKSDMIIPLHFFFSRKFAADEYASNKPNRPYFPLCSIHRQNILFVLEFHNTSFFTDSQQNLYINNFKLITEEISVSPEERNYMINERRLLITDIVKKHPTIVSEPGSRIIVNNLVPNLPVKCIHWFLRNVNFENENDSIGDNITSTETLYYHNRFNFSDSANFDEIETFFNPVMDSASFFINGNKLPNISRTNHNYYKYLIPFHNRLSRPYRNIYTYSFSMNPINVEPSGSLDFSQIKSEKTSIQVILNTTASKIYSLHMYYTGYQTFVFENGFMSLAY